LKRAVVTDIEGTTTALAFVKDTLFPYARRHLANFVRAHRSDPEVALALRGVDDAVGGSGELEHQLATLNSWIDEDRKATPLKSLQGLVWAEGYAHGELRGHVYPDVAPALLRWRAAGAALYVFSSGSITAQKLLFSQSIAGDLTPLFAGYFDTTTGPKHEPTSYRAIEAAIAAPADRLLFLSDAEAELDAAASAGWRTTQVMREGVRAAARHRRVATFGEIEL